jgi:hypothetical protein
VAVAAIMLLPVTALDDPLWSNARLTLAMLVAVALPMTTHQILCVSPPDSVERRTRSGGA